MSALETALTAHWAMLPDSLETLLAIADRKNDVAPEVLEAYRASQAERGERLQVRDGVAILDVTGPLFKRANLFVRISGASSYEILRRDLQVALDDPSISAVMLRVDSPGGEANGCDELAAAIFAARGKKPITAFVSGMACSGGYWLASAAEKVVVSDLAVLGSIGVVLGVSDGKADAKNGRREIVSSMSPGKRPNINTDEGLARVQKMVDDLATVFVAAVAKHRGVSPETVISEFGAGGVEIGANAVAKGMADDVGQFEAAFDALKTRGQNRRSTNRTNGGFLMSNANEAAANETVDVAKIQAEAASKATADAQARIKAIMTSDEGKKLPTQAAHFAYDTNLSADVAIAAMKAALPDVGTKAEGNGGQKSFEEQKAADGALGLATADARDAAEAAKIQDGWAKAVETANRRFV